MGVPRFAVRWGSLPQVELPDQDQDRVALRDRVAREDPRTRSDVSLPPAQTLLGT